MADGSRKPISQVKPGDRVMAAKAATGKATPQTVSAVIVGNGDKDLVDVRVKTADGKTSTLTATAGHPFWVDADGRADTPNGRWIDATQLRQGQWLKTSNGQLVRVAGTAARTQHAQVYNLTVDSGHTYYAIAGTTPVLVHNCPDITVYHYTDKAGFNGIRSGSPYKIRPGNSKNGAGPFFTTRSPDDLTAPNAFKKLGLTSAKSEYVMEFTVPRSSLVPLRGGRGDFVFEIPGGVSVPRGNVRYFGPTEDWEAPE
jgi:hypothetical protein